MRVGRKVMRRLVTREPCTWDTHYMISCEGVTCHLEQEAEAGVGSHQHSQAANYKQLEEADTQPGQEQTPEQ